MFGRKNKTKYDKTIRKAENNLVAARGFSTSLLEESGRYINFSNVLLTTNRQGGLTQKL